MMTLLALFATHFLTSSELANTFTLTKKYLDHHPPTSVFRTITTRFTQFVIVGETVLRT
jgi:hypothetical protein